MKRLSCLMILAVVFFSTTIFAETEADTKTAAEGADKPALSTEPTKTARPAMHHLDIDGSSGARTDGPHGPFGGDEARSYDTDTGLPDVDASDNDQNM